MVRKMHLPLIAQGVITVVLLTLLFHEFDWLSFSALFTKLSISAYLMSLVVVAVGVVLYAWRWCLVLRASGVRVGVGAVLRQSLIGMFIGNFLPSTVGGDVAKAYLFGRVHGYSAVSASIVVDRLLGISILAALAAAALVVGAPDLPIFRVTRTVLVALVAAAVGAVMIIMVGTGGLARRVSRFGPRAARGAERLQRVRLIMLAPLREPNVLLHAAMSVLVYFSLLTLVYQSLIERLGGVRLGLAEILMVVASVTVISNVPVSFNGIGVREQLHVALFSPLGVPKEVAVAISLLLFVHALLISTARGVLWLRAGQKPVPLVVPRT